jgi:hypothetical protein
MLNVMKAHHAHSDKRYKGNHDDFEWAEFLHGGSSAT